MWGVINEKNYQKSFSRQLTTPIIKTMDFIQEYTTRLPMSSYQEAIHVLTNSNAFSESDEARLKLPEDNRDTLESFCGSWTENDIKQFESNTADMNKVDKDDWK